jgi:hypothetical protein
MHRPISICAVDGLEDRIDLVYLLLQLIGLESGDVEAPIPWQLEIARFALPALAGWTFVCAAMALFWEQMLRLTARFWRDHVIICGLSHKGFLLARDSIQEEQKVLIIEINEEHELLDKTSQIGALVLPGDATDPNLLLRAGVPRASALIAVTGVDGTNAEVVVRVNALLSS